jgi:hypothetical protein
MTVIREGSSGEDVRILSTKLGLTPRTICDEELVEAICSYQKAYGFTVDGSFGYECWKNLLVNERISDNPSGKILDTDYTLFSWLLGCEHETLKAFVSIESGGFFLRSGRPVIQFDPYLFWKEIGDRPNTPPDIISKIPVTNYPGGDKEWILLGKAIRISKVAAYNSTRWGFLMIQGSKYQETGEKSVIDFVSKVSKDEFSQFSVGLEYMRSNKVTTFLISKDFKNLARAFNGPSYSKDKIDLKLKEEYYRLKVQK